MNLKDKVLFLGLGNYGCKQAKIFYEMGYKAMFANGSEQDLKLLGNIPNIYRLRGFDGFGGHRERALECLAENEEFIDALGNIKEKIIFPISAFAGSTGSGSLPYSVEILVEEKCIDGKSQKIVCPINAFPALDEAIGKQRNAYKAIQDLQDIEGIGSAFFINNNIDRDYTFINKQFAKLLDVFLTSNSYGELNNFDESERIEMLKDPGAMVLSFGMVGTKADLMLDKLTRDGIFVPIEQDKVCEHIGIIHAGNNSKDIDSSTIIADVGKPQNVFEGYNNGEGTLIAVSGLNYPITYAQKIGDLIRSENEERKRNKSQMIKKLDDLDLEETIPINNVQTKNKTTKLDVLRKRQAEMKR